MTSTTAPAICEALSESERRSHTHLNRHGDRLCGNQHALALGLGDVPGRAPYRATSRSPAQWR